MTYCAVCKHANSKKRYEAWALAVVRGRVFPVPRWFKGALRCDKINLSDELPCDAFEDEPDPRED